MESRLITQYSDVLRLKKSTWKGRAREQALNWLSLIADERYLSKPRIQFLYIHHLFTDEEQKLEALLLQLSKGHTFISYSQAVDKILSGTIDKPYIVFSSDDGFKNNLKAAEILNRYDAKACFFINPGIIGETDFNRIEKYCTETLRFPPVGFLNWDDVTQLQKWGHEIGSHTMMHMNIAEAGVQEINDDMRQTFGVLNEKCGIAKHFAFPYGRFAHFSSVGRKAVFEAGFTSCATAERGCHINPEASLSNTELCIRRDHTVLGWDIRHIMYFLVNNSKKASINNNLYPADIK